MTCLRLRFVPTLLLAAGAVVLLGTAAPARAQGVLVWERVGDHTIDADDLEFAPDDALWAGSSRIWRLDESGGGAGVWDEVADRNALRLLLVSPDTLLRVAGAIYRSLDGGDSWALLHPDGRDFLYEVPHGRPHGGTFMTGTNGGLARSTDRGATWTQAVFETSTSANTMQSAVALANGRIVAAGSNGLLYSDDGGATFHPGSLWEYLRYLGYALGVVEAPVGGERMLAVVADPVRGHLVVYGSADGATWTELAEFTGAFEDGVAGPDVLSLGGTSALVVLNRGAVYQTDNGGASWALVGRAPPDTALTRARSSVIGPDGRLYVALRESDGGVWRTVDPVPVAAEGGPAPNGVGLGLRVEPNPSAGAVALLLTLPTAEARVRVAVYDGLGREVAVAHEGPLGAGEHRLPLNTRELAPGVYVARLVTGRGVAVARLAVTR